MLHTEYKLSETKDCKDALDNAASIIAKYCLDGAIENQKMCGWTATYGALEDWGFRDIIDAYCSSYLVLDIWFKSQEDLRIVEPCNGTWHDELVIDVDDVDIYEKVLDLAVEKLAIYAQKLA